MPVMAGEYIYTGCSYLLICICTLFLRPFPRIGSGALFV